MITHAEIKANAANAIATSEAVRAFCVEHFGRVALVIVDWYGAEGAPGVRESPYVFLYSSGRENETGHVDEETFSFTIELGAVASKDGPAREKVIERTREANGVIVNGCAAVLEELRTIIVGIIKAGGLGATLRTARLNESSTVSYPLEWCSLELDFYEPEDITP